MKSVLLFLIIFQGINAQLLGQPVFNGVRSLGENQVFIRMGLEPELVTTVGYTRCLTSVTNDTHFYIGSSIKVAPLILRNNAWRLNLSPAVSHAISHTLNGLLNADFFFANNSNRAGTMRGLGYEVKALIITNNKKWNKGLELAWQHTPLAYIKHSEATYNNYDERYLGNVEGVAGPIDGWYRATGMRLKFGVLVNRQLSDATVLQMNAGTHFSIQKQKIAFSFPYAQVPFFLNTQLSYQWSQHKRKGKR